MNWNGMRLASTAEERRTYEYEADLYALIVTIERLEKARLRFAVTKEEYHSACKTLLGQLSDLCAQMNFATTNSVDAFMVKYKLTCPAARNRIVTGMAESAASGPVGLNPKYVLEIGQYFITLLDSIKLNQTAKDQLQPLLTDLLDGLERVLPEFDDTGKLKAWHTKLQGMRASEALDEDSARDMAFDVERGYHSLHKALQKLAEKGK